MAARVIRAAYALFLFSFSMWISIILTVCFQNGSWANPVQFPNYTIMGVFVVSAIAASLACMIIGFEYLDIGDGFARRVRARRAGSFEKAKGSHVRLRTTSKKKEHTESLDGDYFVLLDQTEQIDDLNLLVLISKRQQKERFQVISKSELIDETVVVACPRKKESVP